jgi:predicted dehydrogenase
MNDNLTVALIGAGRIAGGYDTGKVPGDQGIYTHAGAYTKDGRFRLKMICDTDLSRAEAFRGQWSVEAATSDLHEVYHGHHDIVSVCTPDASHFEIISELVGGRAAKTIFAEKPLALTQDEIMEINRTAQENKVNVVVNFQRRFDPAHARLKDLIQAGPERLLAVNAYYMKGLEHNGVTLVDTVTYLCGLPRSVLAYNRTFNNEIRSYTYEFILFFDSFNVTVKTIDSAAAGYRYHIFEIDMLFDDQRVIINDNSRTIETRSVIDYAYAGVKALDDRRPHYEESGYRRSMLDAVAYLHAITTGERAHTQNTPDNSYTNKLILNAIVQSYEKSQRIEVKG